MRSEIPKSALNQSCVKALYNSNLPLKFKNEGFKFVKRNLISDCNKVAPSCFKAHLLKTAEKFKINSDKVNNLFKSKIGFNGYYLDNEKLKKYHF